eukprot:CAMPEP_0176006300 /NCGR_PEP_ID=MMETSP0120_2-20121206/2650_1 /TAXON_ID=160619 /ORGANISM="Kryptoperidinium foliaceum, Strain CCMP 1326" /LENGTH=100 /DNA_ID=CAMNT_0017339033 /DNA_START=346 /DNA_END=649 /DNA_ORIENTATION=+
MTKKDDGGSCDLGHVVPAIVPSNNTRPTIDHRLESNLVHVWKALVGFEVPEWFPGTKEIPKEALTVHGENNRDDGRKFELDVSRLGTFLFFDRMGLMVDG